MRKYFLILGFLLVTHTVQAGILLISGAETGGTSVWPSTLGTFSAQTTTFFSGAYAYKLTAPGSESYLSKSGFNTEGPLYVKAKFRAHVTTNPTSQSEYATLRMAVAGGGSNNGFIALIVTTGGGLSLQLRNAANTAIGSAVGISADTWYTLELAIQERHATTGDIEWKLDGVSRASSTSTNTGSAAIDIVHLVARLNGGSLDNYYDDVVIRNDAFHGDSQVITRQGVSGSPTYTAYTKTGGAIDVVWSETPFNATNNAASSSSGVAQTMNTASFSSTQTGHGSEVLDSNDTINACSLLAVMKTGTASSHSLRRRINGVDTDTSKSVTTADALYDDGIWTTTLSLLNSSEIGVLHGANTNSHTVEDVWLMVDYTAVAGSGSVPLFKRYYDLLRSSLLIFQASLLRFICYA